MTKQRRFKQQVRARMAKTGERYAAARGALAGEFAASQGAAADAATPGPPQDWIPPVSDDALVAATGGAWAEWCARLDAAGATAMSHGEVVRHLADEHGLNGWWAQSVTVGYEQARGLRRKHERPDGFEISKTKTVPVPLAELYAAWSDEAARARWLPEPIEVSYRRQDRRLTARWPAGQGRISVYFDAKGAAKARVTVNHQKLDGPEEAERMKELWADRLARLTEVLAGH